VVGAVTVTELVLWMDLSVCEDWEARADLTLGRKEASLCILYLIWLK
jgi:hypothetical protein